MLYIMESLSPGEHIIQPTGYHWMYVFQKFIFLIVCVILAIALIIVGSVYHYYPTLPPWKIMLALHEIKWRELIGGFWSANVMFRIAAFVSIMLGLLHFSIAMVIRATTEIAVTNRRLIYKRGIVARNMNELKIENIEGIIVNQSVLGRIFNYGQMSAHGTGVGEIHFPDYMADPISFRRAIQSARTVVTEPNDYPAERPNREPRREATDEHNDLASAVARHPRGSGGSVDI